MRHCWPELSSHRLPVSSTLQRLRRVLISFGSLAFAFNWLATRRGLTGPPPLLLIRSIVHFFLAPPLGGNVARAVGRETGRLAMLARCPFNWFAVVEILKK